MARTALQDIASAEKSPLWKRVAWLFAIWLASVSTVLIVVEMIRLFLSAAGLKTH
jgi:Protein of unknown function (DUF2474)